MAEFVVYGIPGSPYVRSVLLVLEEKSAPWRIEALKPGEHKAPAYLERHPFGRIPALQHGDFRLYETQAIIRYIDRVVEAPPLTPSEPEAEARMNQIIGITDWYVLPNATAGICFGRVVAPRLGLPVDEARIAASVPQAKLCVNELARLLGDQKFMAGDTLSLADLHLAPHLAFLNEAPEGLAILAPHDRLRGWMERMSARTSMINTGWDRLLEQAVAA